MFMEIESIKNEEDCDWALKEIEKYFEQKPIEHLMLFSILKTLS